MILYTPFIKESSLKPMLPSELHLYFQKQQDDVSAALDLTQAMTMYHSFMQLLGCQDGDADLDYSSISAILHCTAPKWGVALDTDDNCDKQEAAHQQQYALLCAALKRLQHKMPAVTPIVSGISSIFCFFGWAA